MRATALGVFEVDINGRAIGAAVLSPGWSSYEWRVRYTEYDVTESLQAENEWEIRLGPGWYAGRLAWGGWKQLYGSTPAAGADLEIIYEDGHLQIVRTDEDWEWAPSTSVFADLYDGQTIDARLAADWSPVDVRPPAATDFEPYIGPPIERQEMIAPRRVWRSPAGALLVDFGQNLVGWTLLRATGPRGAEVVIRHAEELEHGELALRPLRSARATERYILSGGDDEFEPTFTFHGFRYAEITGWTGDDAELRERLMAVVIGSRLRRTGEFRSSHNLLNRFHENVVWGMRGNFVDVPTDCPQRDERLGWTGDIAVFAPTAVFLFDVQDFLSDWMRDLQLETEHAKGVVPHVVPDPLKRTHDSQGNPVLGSPTPTAVWGDAAAWVPWAMYQHDGDLRRLATHFPVMRLHAETVAHVLDADGLWSAGFQYGDWLDPAAPADDPGAATTPKTVVATAAIHRTFGILRQASAALGDVAAEARYAQLAARVRAAFRRHFLRDGRLQRETTTGYTLAIVFGLLDEGEETAAAGARLADLVRDNGYRIATGFAGTPYVTDALATTGHADEAYRLLLETDCPSWLYPVTMGATTVWERWDSKLPDGTVNPGEMTSFNHYALGSVADWMHRWVGGIAPAEPGYRRVFVAPVPGPGLNWCETKLDSPVGKISVKWSVADGELRVTADIPVPGVLRLPGRSDEGVPAGRHARSIPWPVATP
jgi:alpha-L-rhamnosidase